MKSKSTITFTMIKPDAVQAGNSGVILDKITNAGFKIVALKMTQLSINEAKRFYEIHDGKPFFNDLIAFMTSGPIVAAVLEKDNAVEDFRSLIGKTNPNEAAEGTIRKMFGASLENNAIHGADSNDNGLRESLFHFSEKEIYTSVHEYL